MLCSPLVGSALIWLRLEPQLRLLRDLCRGLSPLTGELRFTLPLALSPGPSPAGDAADRGAGQQGEVPARQQPLLSARDRDRRAGGGQNGVGAAAGSAAGAQSAPRAGPDLPGTGPGRTTPLSLLSGCNISIF